MQGSQDIAVHVGTLHFTAKAVLDAFADDIHPGDVFAVNDPYLGGTHFNDVRLIRPIFHDGELIALAQSNGHWADVGGSVPGSFDVDRQGPLRRGPAHHARPRLGPRAVPRDVVAADRVATRARPRTSTATCTRRPRRRALPSASSSA